MAKLIKTTQKIDVQSIGIKEPVNDIEVFLDFCNNDISAAIKELEKIKTENNRKHLQRLVYVNLVNRFDYLVDKLLLWFAIYNKSLRDEILKSIEQEAISRREVFEIFFMKDRSYDLIIEKIKDLTRSNLLRERHSKKLHKILSKCLEWKNIEKPRVNSDGKIFEKTKKNDKQPNNVLGYTDWLYSRRNSIVHGDGRNYNSIDYDYVVKQYQVKLPKNFRLQIASISSAVNFYKDLLERVKKDLKIVD